MKQCDSCSVFIRFVLIAGLLAFGVSISAQSQGWHRTLPEAMHTEILAMARDDAGRRAALDEAYARYLDACERVDEMTMRFLEWGAGYGDTDFRIEPDYSDDGEVNDDPDQDALDAAMERSWYRVRIAALKECFALDAAYFAAARRILDEDAAEVDRFERGQRRRHLFLERWTPLLTDRLHERGIEFETNEAFAAAVERHHVELDVLLRDLQRRPDRLISLEIEMASRDHDEDRLTALYEEQARQKQAMRRIIERGVEGIAPFLSAAQRRWFDDWILATYYGDSGRMGMHDQFDAAEREALTEAKRAAIGRLRQAWERATRELEEGFRRAHHEAHTPEALHESARRRAVRHLTGEWMPVQANEYDWYLREFHLIHRRYVHLIHEERRS